MNEKWDIVILNELGDGYIVMGPDGYTRFITFEDYKKFKENRNVRYR